MHQRFTGHNSCLKSVPRLSNRRGNMLPFFVILLPALLGILGLIVDGSILRLKYRIVQNAADAAAIAAAESLANGQSISSATSAAVDYVNTYNNLSGANVSVQIPPVDGPYAGQSGFAEVQVSLAVSTIFIQAVGASKSYTASATAVAGNKASTAGAAIVVLDPNPPGLQLPALAGLTLPATPSPYLGGLEVLGLGQLQINGAALVNTDWGGYNVNGVMVGEPSLLRAAVTCMPLTSLTTISSLNLRVTGGVDNPNNYMNYNAGQSSPLKANQSPVADPLINLPVPSTAADSTHVSNTYWGGVTVVGLPLITTTTLQPGVYDYIEIVSGNVVFKSGVYIIRSTNPLTGIALSVLAGQVTANGVMFYITNSGNYNASTGAPDSSNNGANPGSLTLAEIAPSVLLNVGLLGSQYSPLMGTGSPYDGILIYQNQSDRRVIIVSTDLSLTPETYSGTIYAKWGHVLFAGMGTLDAKFVVGSVRFINIGDLTLQPNQLYPAAQDVYLVQ